MSLPLRNWRRGAQSRRPTALRAQPGPHAGTPRVREDDPTDLRILSRPGRTLVNAR